MADITMPATATGSVGTPPAQSGALYFDTTTQRFTFKDVNSALTTLAPFGNSVTVAASGAINTSETIISASFAVPAGCLKAGSSYRLTAYGTCTSTVANVSTFTVRYGAAGTTSDATMGTLTCTAQTSGTTIAFMAEFVLTFRTVGAAGTAIVSGDLTNNGTTGISSTAAVVAVNAAASSIVTTSAGFITLAYKSAATTTTSTFQQVTIEEIKD